MHSAYWRPIRGVTSIGSTQTQEQAAGDRPHTTRGPIKLIHKLSPPSVEPLRRKAKRKVSSYDLDDLGWYQSERLCRSMGDSGGYGRDANSAGPLRYPPGGARQPIHIPGEVRRRRQCGGAGAEGPVDRLLTRFFDKAVEWQSMRKSTRRPSSPTPMTAKTPEAVIPTRGRPSASTASPTSEQGVRSSRPRSFAGRGSGTGTAARCRGQ